MFLGDSPNQGDAREPGLIVLPIRRPYRTIEPPRRKERKVSIEFLSSRSSVAVETTLSDAPRTDPSLWGAIGYGEFTGLNAAAASIRC